jgi:hypothetical protein
MTKEEFDTLKANRPDSGPTASPAAELQSLERQVLRIIAPHLPRLAELFVQASQNGDLEAAMGLLKLWCWASGERRT